MSDFETIDTFDDYLSADYARQKLEDKGIECYLADEYTISIQWTLSNAVGGIKLRVPTGEKEKALKILSEKSEALVADHTMEVNEDNSPICPNCSSNNTRKERISKTSIGWTWLLLGFPISININNEYRCFYCGNLWEIKK